MFIYTGTFLRIKQSCPCGYERTWDSQPFIKNLPAGNILLSAAVLFAGATVTKVFKVFRHLGLVSTSVRSFFFHQTKYLQPVVEHVCHTGIHNYPFYVLGQTQPGKSYTLMDT